MFTPLVDLAILAILLSLVAIAIGIGHDNQKRRQEKDKPRLARTESSHGPEDGPPDGEAGTVSVLPRRRR